jgi:hypothetical protein
MKEAIEKQTFVTGAQAMIMLNSLLDEANEGGPLHVKQLPHSAKFKHQQRARALIDHAEVSNCIETARFVLAEELRVRLFDPGDRRPTNSRLVQLYMSKQDPTRACTQPAWLPIAEAEYEKMLRQAEALVEGPDLVGREPLALPPSLHPRKPRLTRARRACLAEAVGSRRVRQPGCSRQRRDAVTAEIIKWEAMSQETINKFMAPSGLVNECALLYAVKAEYPLHYRVFKQLAGHLPHEANTDRADFLRGRRAERPPDGAWPPRAARLHPQELASV